MKILKYPLLLLLCCSLNLYNGFSQEFKSYNTAFKTLALSSGTFDLNHSGNFNLSNPSAGPDLPYLKSISLQDMDSVNRKALKWHRILGMTVLAGAIGNSITGNLVLKKYNKGVTPSNGLLYTHRALGITTVVLGVANSALGFINFKKLKDEEMGLKKRKIHRILSLLATDGYIALAILGIMSTNDYSTTPPNNVTSGNTHKIVALATTAVTLGAVIVIVL